MTMDVDGSGSKYRKGQMSTGCLGPMPTGPNAECSSNLVRQDTADFKLWLIAVLSSLSLLIRREKLHSAAPQSTKLTVDDAVTITTKNALRDRKPPPSRYLDCFQSHDHSILHITFPIGGPLSLTVFKIFVPNKTC